MEWWTRRTTWQKVTIGIVGAFIALGIIGSIVGESEAEHEAAATSTTASTTTTSTADTTTSTAATSTTTTSPTDTTSSPTSTQPTTTTSTTTLATTTTVAQGVSIPAGAELVSVTHITDGDTIDVRYDDGTVEAVRLIGINAPEGGECYATEATAALKSIAGDQIVMTSDVSNRDIYDRLLRYLWTVDGELINETLVAEGFAIARDYPPDSQYASTFAKAQAKAESTGAGMWAADACGTPTGADLRIGHIEYDAPGNDHENLNGEWVEIINNGTTDQQMRGWVLKDESASHRYNFPSGYVLTGGTTVRVYTGCGSNTATELYWCNGSAIWNNDGDTVFLLDPNGNTVAKRSY
jgi:micrococcal nuclease